MYLQTITKVCLFGGERKCKHRTNTNFSALFSLSSKAKAYWNKQSIWLTAVLRHKTQYSVEVVIFYVSCHMTRNKWRLYQRMLMIVLVLLNCGVVRDAALLGMMWRNSKKDFDCGAGHGGIRGAESWRLVLYFFQSLSFPQYWGRYLLCKLNIYF